MPPIPFKNLSAFNFTLEVEAITNESFANRPYDIVTQNFVNCQANMQFFVNLQLKENMNYKGVMPLRDTIRKVLILKIKNSSVYFNYPLEVNVFESTNSGGMSWSFIFPQYQSYLLSYQIIKSIFSNYKASANFEESNQFGFIMKL